MKRRATTGGKANQARSRKPAKRKSRILPPVVRGRGSSDADLQEQLDRAKRELKEAIEQQTATSEVLRVISSSPGTLEPVFEAMLSNAVRICEAGFGVLWLAEGTGFRSVALHRVPPALAEARLKEPFITDFGPNSGVGQVIRTKRTILHRQLCDRARLCRARPPRRVPRRTRRRTDRHLYTHAEG